MPIYALTGNAMKGFEQECRAAGCTGYLTKPIDIDLLLETLAGVLGGTREKVEPRPSETVQPAPAAPSAAADSTPIVSRLAGGGPRIRATIGKFAMRLGDKLDEMESSWQQRDFDQLAALAHWLKGSGGTVGYDDFTEPAKKLEGFAKAKDEGQIPPVLAELRNLADRVVVPNQDDVAA